MKLCEWCKEEPVKLKKNECCSISCASELRWSRKLEHEKTINLKRMEAAKKTAYAKRLNAEFLRICTKYAINPTKSIRSLFIESRNRGYLNGWSTASRRQQRFKGILRNS